MILYLDTSALLKLYVKERESREVRAAVARAAMVATHLLTYAEMRAALAKAHRLGRITRAALATHRSSFEADWARLEVVLPTEALVRRAGDLAEEHGLRGYDSLQLSAAEELRHLAGVEVEFLFAAFGAGLRRAAVAKGLRLMD